MKTYLGCGNKRIFKQIPRFFTSGHKRSVREIQSRIFQARIQGKITDVHALQESLCDSFCAKLLATDYAINSVEASYVSKTQPPLTRQSKLLQDNVLQRMRLAKPRFASHTVHNYVVQSQASKSWQQKLRECVKPKQDTLSFLSMAKESFANSQLFKDLPQKHDTSMGHQEQNEKRSDPAASVPFVEYTFATRWRISIAKSLWLQNGSSCHNICFSVKKGFQEPTQSLQPQQSCGKSRCFCLKGNKGKKDCQTLFGNTCSAFLEKSVRSQIHKAAQQIHALLALEPEWQAVFVLQRICQDKEKVVTNSIVSRTNKTLMHAQRSCVKEEQTPLFSQPKQRVYNSTVADTQFLALHNHVYVNPEPVIKQIREQLKGSFPKHVVTISIKEWLHAIDHQVLINQLNTFPQMQKQVDGWLKGGILQTNQIASRDVKDLFGKENTYSTSHAKLWRTSVFQEDEDAQRSCAQSIKSPAKLSSLASKCFVYSTFPKTLWKEHDHAYDLTQIESHNDLRECIITSLLTRIVLHGLVERVQQYANKLFSVCSKHNAVCLRQGTQLCFVSTNVVWRASECARHDHAQRSCAHFANKHFMQKENVWGGFSWSDLCSLKSRQGFFCSGHEDRFVMLSCNKKLLEVCLLQVKTYLLEIAHVDFHPSLEKNQDYSFTTSLCNKLPNAVWQLKKQDKSKRGFSKIQSNVFANCQSRKTIEKDSALSASNLGYAQRSGAHLFPSKDRLKLTKDLYTSVCKASPCTDCRQGFSFFGFQIIQIQRKDSYVCAVTPSRESVRDLLLLITGKVKQSRSASTDMWINRLNPLLLRWVEYYKHCEYRRSYDQISYLIWEKTRTWMARRKVRKRR